MLLIPAIDLKDGHCVRLKQGDMDQSTTFGEDPAAMARKWVDAGARRLHLVDLNGAFAGVPKNYGAIKSILKEVGSDIPVQLGGGIRDLDTIEKYIDGGLRYVIIGTAAVKNPGFLKDACSAFGGHIIKFEDWGVESIIYTDIGRDGMLSGINIDATVKLAQSLSIPVIASGGLSNMADIEQLCAVEGEGVEGVICGRAIYSGDLDFAAAQARADELNALQGAQVLSWVSGGRERLFLSPANHWDGHTAIRGGIPVCFPQFNARGNLPRHGFARNLPWQAAQPLEQADHAQLDCTLTADDHTRAIWPQAFEAHLRVSITPGQLQVTLSVDNQGPTPLSFSGALHTYLALDDIGQARLTGLGGQAEWDALTDARAPADAALRFEGEFDRVYAAAAAPLLLEDGAHRLEIAQSPQWVDTV
eukprot:gene38261-50195_t